MNKPPLMRAREVAFELGVTSGRVYQLIAAGVIPSVRINRSLFVPRGAWDAWLRKHTVDALTNSAHSIDSTSDDSAA